MREVYSDKSLLQKIKISNKKSNFTTKGARKREKQNPNLLEGMK